MGVQITKYSVCAWGDKNTGETYYGIRVFVAGSGWMNCCEGTRPILLASRKEARDYIAKMKSERDADGFKKAVRAVA